MLLTTGEIANILEVSSQTVINLCDDHGLQYSRMHKRAPRKIDLADAIDFFSKGEYENPHVLNKLHAYNPEEEKEKRKQSRERYLRLQPAAKIFEKQLKAWSGVIPHQVRIAGEQLLLQLDRAAIYRTEKNDSAT